MMKRAILVVAVVVFVFGVDSAIASVQIEDGDWLVISNSTLRSPSFSGGPFQARVYDENPAMNPSASPRGGSPFLTFCLQKSQTFAWNTPYEVALGLSNDSPGHLLTGYAAWVYQKFLVDSSLTVAKAEKYQRAIWAGMVLKANLAQVTFDDLGGNLSLEQITDWSTYENYGFGRGSYRTAIGGESNFATEIQEVGDVKVIRLAGAQDQAVLVPDLVPPPPPPVPEPASLAIWSVLAMGAAGVAARRRASRRRWTDDQRRAIRDLVTKA
jgi:hypothetical protein